MEHFTCGSLGKTRSHTYLVGVLSALLAGTVSGGEEAYAAHAVVYGGACRKQRALSCRARHAGNAHRSAGGGVLASRAVIAIGGLVLPSL